MFHILTNELRSLHPVDLGKIALELTEENWKLRPLITDFLNRQGGSQGQWLTLEEFHLAAKQKDKMAENALRALGDSVFLDLNDFDKATEEFKNHYSVNGVGHNVAFPDASVFWDDLKKDVGLEPEDLKVAYKFYHRFDPATTSWHITAHRHKLAIRGDIGNWTDISDTGAPLFDITAKGIVRPASGGLIDVNGTKLDPEYLKGIESADKYADGERVWGFTLPAKELSLVIENNLLLGGAQSDFKLNFRCISYKIDPPEPRAKVAFPHCVVVYASDKGKNYVTNGAVVVGAQFRGKAANMETLCPPNCTRYFWPADLPA